MLKPAKLVTVVLTISFLLAFITGCGNSVQDSALIGAAIGTGIGAIAGGDPASMMIGGAAGGGIGLWFGSEQEKKKTEVAQSRQSRSLKALENSEIIWVTNSNGSKTPVKISRNGDNFVGPRNEYYASLPTEQQLVSVYGF